MGRRGHAVSRDAMQPDSVLAEILPRLKKLARFVHRKLPANVTLDDLLQCGLIGAWKAAQTHDGSRASYPTYALRKARWEMLEFLRDKVSEGTRRHYVTTESFDETRVQREDADSVYDDVLARERTCALAREVHKLPPRERFVLRSMFSDVPCSDIACTLSVSEARVWQLRRQGLCRLRDRMRIYL